MEIVKRGQLPGDEVHECTCRNCRSVLRFKAGDVARVFDQRDGDFYRFKCPVCEQDVTVGVNASGLPRIPQPGSMVIR